MRPPKTKVCNTCNKRRAIEKFPLRWHKERHKSYRANKCQPCMNAYQRANYYQAKMDIKEWVMDHLLSHPCIECGEDRPLRLQFDHLSGKKFNVGRFMVGKKKTLGVIQQEIAKCVVRCAGCHQEKTQYEQNTWRVRLLHERGLI